MAFEFRFYNAGQRISETLKYDNPLLDQKTSNLVAYHQLDAPEKGFFTLPREMTTIHGGRFSVPFDQEVMNRFGKRGVIFIDKNLEPDSISEDQPIAANEKDAQRKGEKFWLAFLKEKADEWLEHCANVRQAGGFPKSAQGFHKHALETLGIQDPGAVVDNLTSKNASNDEMSALKAQIAELQKAVAGKK